MSQHTPQIRILSELNRLIEQADRFPGVRLQALMELRFTPSREGIAGRIGNATLAKLDTVNLGAMLIVLLSLSVLPALLANFIAEAMPNLKVFSTIKAFAASDYFKLAPLPVFSVLFTYQNWRRNIRSNAVDHALKRKEITNSIITEDAKLLMPLVESALTISQLVQPEKMNAEDQAKIDMYIFSEIDNLEYVFEKSRNRLIDEDYTLRAIKIFIARCENPQFSRGARILVHRGRYNYEFKSTAITLIELGQWRHIIFIKDRAGDLSGKLVYA